MTLTLTLESSPKVKLFETYQLRKTSQNMLGYYAPGIIYGGTVLLGGGLRSPSAFLVCVCDPSIDLDESVC